MLKILTVEALSKTAPAFLAPRATATTHTIRRAAFEQSDIQGSGGFIKGLTSLISLRKYPKNAIGYLDLLDRCLDDVHISKTENRLLKALSASAGLEPRQVAMLHSQYFGDMYQAALRDSLLSAAEVETLMKVAEVLEVDLKNYKLDEEVTAEQQQHIPIEPGQHVCFTGSYVDNDGTYIDREELFELALSLGLVPEATITKSRTSFLVAQDVHGQSTKLDKARRWDKPVITYAEFIKHATTRV